MDIPGITVILPTLSAVPTRSSSQTESDSDQASRTLSNDEPTSTGSRDYPVFPNGDYIQKFYRVNQKLTKLDVDLYNACYLPFRNLPYDNYNEKRAVRGDGPDEEPLPPNAPQPTYEITSAPCKRQASINANCYFKNTNGTYSGLEVSQEWDVQQQCYCEQYPFFDSVKGCMECFRQHGGIAGKFFSLTSQTDIRHIGTKE